MGEQRTPVRVFRRFGGDVLRYLGLMEPRPAHPDLGRLVKTDPTLWGQSIAARPADSQNVLMATVTGGHLACATFEGALSLALTLRGAEVHVLLCDGVMPACLECEHSRYPDFEQFTAVGPQADRCKPCFDAAARMYSVEGITVHRYSELLKEDDLEAARDQAQRLTWAEMLAYQQEGVSIGEHALAGALRFYARGDIANEPTADRVLRRYFQAALLTSTATKRLLEQEAIDVTVMLHGIYVPHGLIAETARTRDVRVVCWNPAYRKQCFILSHGGTYHHTLMEEPVSEWEDIEWTPALEERTMEYLSSRWHGTNDWIWFHEKPELSAESIAAEIGVDFSRPCIGMLTNVVWDAQLHYPANAFPSMIDWIVQTMEYFRERPDLQLMIRVHPAEIRGTLPSRQRVADEIARHFPELPGNVFVIPPESNVSTYAAMAQCDSVIIFGTKTGVELTSMGIPVIVAGEAWIRNKGITLDATSVADYRALLDRLPFASKLEGEALERARKYAFHFFMRRMIPVDAMVSGGKSSPYRLGAARLSDLSAGRSPGLDIVCDGILNGSRFVIPAEFELPAERP